MRGIYLISNLCNLFIAILKFRILYGSFDNNAIADTPFGFKQNYGTRDAFLHGIQF